jgi:hypothetical protein
VIVGENFALDDARGSANVADAWEVAMPDRSIKFVPAKHPTPDAPADLVLDEPGNPPSPFNVFLSDNISWNNATQQDHWPWLFDIVDPANSDPNKRVRHQPDQNQPRPPAAGSLKPRDSTPNYSVATGVGSVIYFCCRLHPKEFGCIVVVAPGQGSGPAVA